MPSKKALATALAIFIVIASLFTFTRTNLSAQYYSPGAETLCGASVRFQVRLFGDTQAYADSGLTRPAVVLRANAPDLSRSKWLICESSIGQRAWAIFFVNRLLWIPAGSGELVPRQFRDDQR